MSLVYKEYQGRLKNIKKEEPFSNLLEQVAYKMQVVTNDG